MFQFEPNLAQARQNNTLMHEALGRSLDSLIHQVGADILTANAAQFAAWRTHMSQTPALRPEVFGAYYELVAALKADRFNDARALWEEIVSAPSSDPKARIYRLGHDYSDAITRRFQKFMGNGKTNAAGIAPASVEDCDDTTVALDAAFGLIERHWPDLLTEFNEIIRDVVLVGSDSETADAFEGGSSFKLWGGLFLNAEWETTPAQLAATLAHEEAHCVLFGACREETLVENPDSELYWSAIRQANRPLEGIFHATFVSARMIRLLTLFTTSPELSADEII
ncbi:MAG: HEXXH motif-containing putative peptide modification protein, partial [Pseudomonadota bacterium]